MALGIPMAILGAAGISAGGGILGGLLADEPEGPQITQLPDYAESEGARGMWWEQLQGMTPENNFGAITPAWDDIWQRAINRVKDYYTGTPTSPGAFQSLEGEYAARGMTGQPAEGRAMTRLAAQRGEQTAGLATDQAISEADFGERARVNYMNSLMVLAQLKPQFNVSQPQPQYGVGNMIADVSSGIGGAMSQYGMGQMQQQQLANSPMYMDYLYGRGYGAGTPMGVVDMGNYSKLPLN